MCTTTERRVYVDNETGEWVLDLGHGKPLIRYRSLRKIEEYLEWLDAGKPQEVTS